MNGRLDRSASAKTIRALALAVSAGLGLGFAWPGSPVDAPALAFFFLVPWLAAIQDSGPWRRMLLSWIAGSIAVSVAAGETTAEALASYFELSGASLALAWTSAHQLIGVLPLVLFGLLAFQAERVAPWRQFVDVGSAWVASEALRSVVFPGPWLSLASGLTTTPGWIGSAAWIGSAGVGFWIAGLGALLFRVVAGPDRRRSAALVAAIVGIVALQAARSTDRSENPGEPGTVEPVSNASLPAADATRFTLVQSGVEASPADARPTDSVALDRLIEISRESSAGSDVVVWPEGSVRNVWPINARRFTHELRSRLEVRNVLLGVPWIDDPLRGATLSVAAVLVDGKGRFAGIHRKTRLVPIAEDGPIGHAGGSDDAGLAYRPAANLEPLQSTGPKLGVFICYEILFDELARDHVRSGAEVLVNLSNESWLGSGLQGRRHMLSAAVLRAIETGRPLLRSTTTGITAAIDARGRVVSRLASGSSGALQVDVTPASHTTIFTRIGTVPIWAACMGWTLVRIVRRARGPAHPATR